MLAGIQSLCYVSACRHCHLPRKALCERDISYKLAPRMQGTCAFEAQNVIKLLTFDQVEKEKAAGQASTALSARLADLIQDYRGASLFRPPRSYTCSNSFGYICAPQQPWESCNTLCSPLLHSIHARV